MNNHQVITDSLQDDGSLGDCSFEEIVHEVCCHHPRSKDNSSETAEQPPAKKRKVGKRVRIAEQENEFFYRTYDPEEMKSAWMSENDFEEIRQRNRETLVTILKSLGEMSKVNAHEFCLRGLEIHIEMFYTKTGREEHKKVVQQVLENQKTLRSFGIHDPETLGKVYAELSRRATRRALELAFIDAIR